MGNIYVARDEDLMHSNDYFYSHEKGIEVSINNIRRNWAYEYIYYHNIDL